MTNSSSDHFGELKEWSERKLTLLSKYLDSAVKILQIKGRVYYVDCFAGKGYYGKDNEIKLPGSPVRAAMLAQKYRDEARTYSLECVNIEENAGNYRELEAATAQYRQFTTNLRGTFANNVAQIVRLSSKNPTICFLDPFGVEGMDWEAVRQLIQRSGTTDLWIRFDVDAVRRRSGWYNKIGTDPQAVNQYSVLTRVYGFDDAQKLHMYLDGPRTETARKQAALDLYLHILREELQRIKHTNYVYEYRIGSLEEEVKYYLIIATAHPKAAVLASNIVHDIEQEYRRAVDRLKRENYIATLFDEIDPTPEEIQAALITELKERVWPSYKGRSISRTNLHSELIVGHFAEFKGKHLTAVISELYKEHKIASLSNPAAPSGEDNIITFKS